jgi:hypothetical protein
LQVFEGQGEKWSAMRRIGGAVLLLRAAGEHISNREKGIAMKKVSFFILLGLSLVSVAVLVAAAWGQSSRRVHYSTMFNPATVGTLSGEVVRVEHTVSGNGADYCVLAQLKTPQGLVTAVLAPHSYMQAQQLTIAPGDRVTVTGSRITVLGKPFILVTEVQGDRTMHLRASNGRPAWAVGDDWHVRTVPSRKLSAPPAAGPDS